MIRGTMSNEMQSILHLALWIDGSLYPTKGEDNKFVNKAV